MTISNVMSCSMYKITLNGKTMVGSNFDAYYLMPRIWFEKGTKVGFYGAVFVGGRVDEFGIAPQSGMNEVGLTFTRQQAPPPQKEPKPATNKKIITDPTHYLKDILHTCKSIEEVKNYIAQYCDEGFFREEVIIYIERSGRYLIVEADTMIMGNKPKYVLSNFCPSQVSDISTIKQVRYRNGVAFLKNKIDTSIAFCTALSDTMHVCREKIGDGTLLTLIRDLNEGTIYLNFYHDYKHYVKFNLNEELVKGDHILEVPALFPPNSEFEKLVSFRIPHNTRLLMLFMYFCLGLFLFSSMFFFISFFRKRKAGSGAVINYRLVKFLLFLTSGILLYYITVLIRNQNIYYFPAPYKDYVFSMVDIASYIPFLLLLLIIPFVRTNFKIFKEKAWGNFSKWLFTINNLTYFTLLILFSYWGLFNIF